MEVYSMQKIVRLFSSEKEQENLISEEANAILRISLDRKANYVSAKDIVFFSQNPNRFYQVEFLAICDSFVSVIQFFGLEKIFPNQSIDTLLSRFNSIHVKTLSKKWKFVVMELVYIPDFKIKAAENISTFNYKPLDLF